MKKLVSILLTVLLAFSAMGANAQSTDFGGVFPAIAGENGTTYVSLFDVIISDEWTPVWQEYISAVLGDNAAPEMTGRLQSSITSELYGEAAVAAFANGGYAFDCGFINGAEHIGDFVGGGFLSDEMIVYGPPFDQPTNYELTDCTAE